MPGSVAGSAAAGSAAAGFAFGLGLGGLLGVSLLSEAGKMGES